MLKPLTFFSLIVLSIIAYIYSRQIPIATIVAWVQSIKYNTVSFPIYISISILVCFITLPLGVLTKVLSGWLFGFKLGFLVSYLSILAGSWLAFLFARYTAKDFIWKKWMKPIRKVNAKIQDNSMLSLIQIRLFPFLPLPITNFSLGFTHINNTQFIFSSAIGMFPATVFYALIGAKLNDLNSETLNFKYFTPYYIYICLALLATLCLELLRKKKNPNLESKGAFLQPYSLNKDISYKHEIVPFLESSRSSFPNHAWDEQAIPSYLHSIAIVRYVFWKRVHAAIKLAKNSERALDYGCGAGATFPWLHRKFKEVIAYDIDTKSQTAAQQICKKNNWNNIKILSETIEIIPNESIDVIFALDVLEHIDALPELLIEFKRILKPKGVIIVSSPTENFVYKFVRKFAGTGYQGEFHLKAATEVECDLAQTFNVKLRKRIFPIFTFFRIVTATKK